MNKYYILPAILSCLFMLFIGCMGISSSSTDKAVSKAQAVSRARSLATQEGYDLNQFQDPQVDLDSFEGRPVWIIDFKGKPPVTFGLNFSVWIYVATGEGILFPGE